MRRIVDTAVKEGSFYTALAFFVVLAAFPFYWMMITAFKTNADLYQVANIPFWFNQSPTLEHFRYLFGQTLFGRWLLNSLIIGVCVVAITLATAIPAGYALTRLAGRNAEALGIGIFLTYLVPPTLLFLPLSRRLLAWPRKFDVVAGRRLPHLYDPVLHLAADGVLQDGAARDRRGRDRRRL